ncbi:MAG: haloacid dehalogenase, type II [Betaproteobacteria bacterium TMED82]|nr:MAG: haloacid dehalogenase, type II [Betaproteobacteria bacterium TMED82]|tara:strand:+ start:83073 stop:83756 length:684 start_codon:yes stop_codon:yes gene_type:complete
MLTLAFDVYGTLFNVNSMQVLLEKFSPGSGKIATQLWREKQIEYTRLLVMRQQKGDYQSFWDVTIAALDFTSNSLGLGLTTLQKRELMASYEHLDLFSEVEDVLMNLRGMGIQLVILSNGNYKMLSRLLLNARLNRMFDEVFSAESVSSFKIDPAVYGLIKKNLNVEKKDVILVSSNCWDIIGGGWYGFRTFWVNRNNDVFDELRYLPDFTGNDLNDLLAQIKIKYG